MVFDGIIASFIVGFLRKGNLRGLAKLHLKWGWIFPLLLLFQMIVFTLQNKVSFLGTTSGYIYIGVYIIGMLFLFLNRDNPGFIIILIGVFLNFIVMAVNGGRMPVSLEAASILEPGYLDILKHELYAKHALLTEATKLGFLGDIIPLSDPYPRTQIISIGDVIMNIGAFVFIQHLMLHHRNVDKLDAHLQLEGGETK
ncbi:DUF5317 domain-containing protein [Cytobacillus sp. FJAT-54145]|uniref:DUF5317 domain-containing protein n=1 Tax=Cytobacillus spartinae TaxID=3299023 RepID=A0ABW6KBV5_9BACI